MTLVSYNCKHFKDRGPTFDFMCAIVNECDIVFLQEHCLYTSELLKLCKLGDKLAITGKRSMDESVPREGRPYGGCAILWKSSLTVLVKELTCNHVRLCGIMIKLSNNSTLVCLNVYMPCDGRAEDNTFLEYMEVLSEIEQLIHIHNPAHVIYGGDMNTDMSRNTPHALAMRQFLSDFNYTACIDTPISEVLGSCTGRASARGPGRPAAHGPGRARLL